MELILLLGIIYLLNLVSGCFLIPNDETPITVICQGRGITQFPSFTNKQKELIETIIISQTYISSLPILEKMEYMTLFIFDEIDNILLDCNYIFNWMKYQTNTTFYSTCVLPSSTTYETSSFFTIDTTTSITSNTTEYEITSISLENNTFFPSTYPPSNKMEPYVTAIIIICTFILVIITISFLYFRFKRSTPPPRQIRQSPYLHTQGLDGIEMHSFQNQNYDRPLNNPPIYNPNRLVTHTTNPSIKMEIVENMNYHDSPISPRIENNNEYRTAPKLESRKNNHRIPTTPQIPTSHNSTIYTPTVVAIDSPIM